MNQVYALSKDELASYLDQGMSSRDIEKKTGHKYWNILYWIEQYGLSKNSKYSKPAYQEDYFHKIDTKEKAYLLGFFLGDGCVTQKGDLIVNVALSDKEILDFAAEQIGCRVCISTTTNASRKQFPHATIKISNPTLCRDLGMLFGGRTKTERHIPRIAKHLEPYLVLGFFDAEGCITWGIRKDRNRVWQKVSFTSQYNMLCTIQNILDKNDISSRIHRKSNENCYVLEMANPQRVLQVMQYIYADSNFVILKRKYNKYMALRLELGEFGESLLGQHRAEPAEQEGVETSGAVATQLNDRISTQALNNARYSPTLAAMQDNG